MLEFKLKNEGYQTFSTTNPLEAVSKARDVSPDLIVLDVMMPELDGFRLCSMLKVDSKLKNIPILFLTAKTEVDDRVKGFTRGADDYLTKPFDSRELVARIKVLLARTLRKQVAMQGKLLAGGIALDPESHEVTIDGKLIDLTNTEFKLLHLMMERTGRVQSRENLLVNVWNYDTEIETRTVDNLSLIHI